MSLEMTPNVFGRIKFPGLGRQELELDGAIAFDVVTYPAAVVRTYPIPNDEHQFREVLTQRFEDLE